MTRSKGMHKEDIKAAVRKTGITLRQLSLDAGLDPSSCCKSLTERMPKANRLIADRIGRPLHSIWPYWFDQDGLPLKSPNRKRKKRRSHCQKSS